MLSLTDLPTDKIKYNEAKSNFTMGVIPQSGFRENSELDNLELRERRSF